MSGISTIRLGRILYIQNFSQCLGHNIRLRVSSSVMKYCTSATGDAQAEKMQTLLQNRFPKAKKIIVNDLSGGCGSMYDIFVETVEFKGLPLVKQHMLINEILKEQIKDMHGLTIKTKIPDAS